MRAYVGCLFHLFGFLTVNSLPVLLLVIANLARSEVFVDKGGFLKWELSQIPVLAGAEDKLEMKFKACNERGLLIYQAGQAQNFFSMGIFNGRIYIEASLSGQLLEMFVGDENNPPVQRNQTHEIVITNMREHHLGQMRAVVDGQNAPLAVLTDVQPQLSFTDPNLLGNTFIGGYKEVNDLRLRSDRLYNYPIVCISYLRVGTPAREVDLTSPTEGTGQVVPTCPVCAPPSIVTLRSSRSYMKVEADLQPRSGTTISFKFRTKAQNGLLFYFGGPAWLVVYLKDGKAVLRLNTKGSGADQSYVSTNAFNDGQEQELFIERDVNTATMKDRAGNTIALVTFQGEGADAAHSLNVNSLYVGGFKNPVTDLTTDAKQYIEVTESLRGCMEEFRFVSYSSVQETANQIDLKTKTIESRETTFDQCHELDTCLFKECTGVGQVCNLGVCECKPGWNEQTPGADPLVCIDVDECQSNPCRNGGACINMENAYRCQCLEQYKGVNCETERNCYNFPCENGGTCTEGTSPTPSVSGRNCSCPQGFYGVSCVDDVDECSLPNNCVGTCENLVGSYECTCVEGYDGYLCRDVIDDCANNPCEPDQCYSFIRGYNCTCADDPEARVLNSKSCNRAVEVMNGQIIATDGFCSGAVIYFNCDPGYELIGSSAATCREDGSWNQDIPTCQRAGVSTTIIAIIVVVIGVVLIAVVVTVVFLVRRRGACDKSPANTPNSVELENVASNSDDGYQSLKIPHRQKSDHTYQGLKARRENEETPEAAYEDVKPPAEFPRGQLDIKEELGHGEFGSVYKAEAWKIDGNTGVTTVAVKELKGMSSFASAAFLKELAVLKLLGTHPNVVSFLGCCTDTEPFYLLLEYVSGGSLQSNLRTSRTQQTYGNLHGGSKSLSSRDLTKFAWDVAKGMTFLSSKKILHRDLATRNVLVAGDKTCKVSDFGLSREGDEYERTTKTRLPIRWMPPESLFHRKYTTKSDVWAFGVLLWEIVTLGATPYNGMSKREVMDGVQQGYRMGKPPHCDEKLYTLMLSCWNADPAQRPEFRKIQRTLDTLMETEHDYIDLLHLDENTYQSLQTATDEKY